MANNRHDGERQLPYPSVDAGMGRESALQNRSTAILGALQGFLASNYRATIPSPEYAKFLRSIARELAKITLGLEDLGLDMSFETVRSELLYQNVAKLLFQDALPVQDLSDEGFRAFLLTVIQIFFQGSTPESMADAVRLFTDLDFEISENFLGARDPNSALDISDQFGFEVKIDLQSGPTPPNLFEIQANLMLLLDIVKPAHVLYRVAYVFKDSLPEQPGREFSDASSWSIHDHRYDDVRKYCKGMHGWVSSTGFTQALSLTTLEDTRVEVPFSSVKPGATLIVPGLGPNTGTYTVVSAGLQTVEVTPRFKEAQQNMTYRIEVDHLGFNQEVAVVLEDVSNQFISPILLDVQLDSAIYNVGTSGTITVTALANYGGVVQYNWDLTGNNDFTDAAGPSITYTAQATPGTRLVRVEAVSEDGRVARAESVVIIT